MSRSLTRHLRSTLADADAAARRRTRRIVSTPDPAAPTRVRVDGRDCIAYCSNDYLGLAGDIRLIEAFVSAAREHGVGSRASHLVSGHGPEHAALEEALADFCGRERALVFSTGYMANLGIASALVGRGDLVVEDRLNHASLLDAGLASGARFARYAHGDAAAAAALLETADAGHRILLTDGVFSMDGDLAPLAALAAIAEQHDAWLVVDDAHGFGVLGEHGRGTLETARVPDASVPVLMATFGKALGTFGAFVAGSRELIDALVQRARTYIYTTALPPAITRATRVALELVGSEPWRRTHVLALVERFRAGAAAIGLELMPSHTPIQPVVLGSEERALAASDHLLASGCLVPAIRPPTVPARSSRLRITFSAAHATEDVDRLLEVLADWQARSAAKAP